MNVPSTTSPARTGTDCLSTVTSPLSVTSALTGGTPTLVVTTLTNAGQLGRETIAGLTMQIGFDSNTVAAGAANVTLASGSTLHLVGNVTVNVEPEDGKGRVGFETVDEGRYVDGVWQAGRRLNGDQTHQGRHIRLPPGDYGVQRFTLYRYP